MAFVVPGFLALVGVLLIGLRGWLWLRAPRRHLCPGPRLNWRQRLVPVRLIFRPRCGYDLSGHLARHRLEMGSAIICPECGRDLQRTRQMIRTPRAWRPAHLGAIFILAGLLVYRHPPLSAMTVVQYTPTDMLLRGEGLLGVGTPLEVRDEIRRRAMDHQLRDDQVCRFVQLLVNDLRDDALAGNARAAIDHLAIFGVFCAEPLMAALESADRQQRALVTEALRDLPDGSADRNRIICISLDDLRSDRSEWTRRHARRYLMGHLEFAQPLLIEALASDDQQQRRGAAWALRHAQTDGATFQTIVAMSIDELRDDEYQNNLDAARWFLYQHRERVKDDLLEVLDSDDRQQREAVMGILRETTLEGAGLDRMLRRSVHDLRLEVYGHRTYRTFHYVLQHASSTDPLLLRGMHGDDPQQRLLCAAIAGCAARLSLMEAAAPILVSHLADNDVGGDASIAARALYGFGAPVLPLLNPGRRSPDEQQRQAVEYIIRRMTTTDSIALLQHELPLARLTLAKIDALALEPIQFDMPRFPSGR